MPGSRVPSVEKILQEVYGDIEQYSRSGKGRAAMDRNRRSSGHYSSSRSRRTDSRYRSDQEIHEIHTYFPQLS